MSTITTGLTSSSIITDPPRNNGPGNRNLVDNNNPPSSASTTLYLYVFLAALVIVGCSCSGIMTRSFLQRRRHRYLIEGAIHLEFGVDREPRGMSVNTSKEPKIWEMFIKGQNVVCSGHVDAEWDWDSIKPLSATTTERSSSQKITLYSDSRLVNSVSPLTDRERIRGIVNRSPPLPESDTPTKSSTSAPKLRSIATVTTLIAMPSRALRMSSQLNQSAPSSLSSANSPSVPPPLLKSEASVIPTPSLIHPILPSPSSLVPQQATGMLPSECRAEPLPYVEFGIVELVLREERHKEGSYQVV